MSTGLLVASPQMVDSFFTKTVVLLCEYNEDGAIGIVVNRVTDLEADMVLEQMEIDDGGGISGPVHWGGPVQPGAVFLTYRRPSVGDDTTEEAVFLVGDTLGVSPARGVMEAVSGDAANPGAFLSLGYAGWAPGQLDGEIESGSWIFLDADPDVLFEMPPEDRWRHCIASLGVDPAMIWMQPIDE